MMGHEKSEWQRAGDSIPPVADCMKLDFRQLLRQGLVIPACPLALNAQRRLDERRQRALIRYYMSAGAGGLAAGVHTTQFAIRDASVGLFEPVLALIAGELDRADAGRPEPIVRIAGVCGQTKQAVKEAGIIHKLGYHAALLSLGALKDANDDGLLAHCRAVAETRSPGRILPPAPPREGVCCHSHFGPG